MYVTLPFQDSGIMKSRAERMLSVEMIDVYKEAVPHICTYELIIDVIAYKTQIKKCANPNKTKSQHGEVSDNHSHS